MKRCWVALLTTFEHLRCWREDLYVRPVGNALRGCKFEITSFCLRIRSSPERMPGFDFWVKICLSGPNSVNAYVGRSFGWTAIKFRLSTRKHQTKKSVVEISRILYWTLDFVCRVQVLRSRKMIFVPYVFLSAKYISHKVHLQHRL